MRWCAALMAIVRSISLRRKARPGRITEQAKFKRPINDCNSSKVTILRWRNWEINWVHLLSLSWGKRASDWTVSSSIPAKERVVEGPQVFSGAIGIPKYLHKLKKISNCVWQSNSDGVTIKKSSSKWRMLWMPSFFWAIHSTEVLF